MAPSPVSPSVTLTDVYSDGVFVPQSLMECSRSWQQNTILGQNKSDYLQIGFDKLSQRLSFPFDWAKGWELKRNWENDSSMKLSHKMPINLDKVSIKTFLYNLNFDKVYHVQAFKVFSIIKIFCCDIFKCITLWLPVCWPYEHFLCRAAGPDISSQK